MTADEAKQSLFSKSPVMYNGIRYAKMTAIIYRVGENNNLIVSAELLDKSQNSVTYALIKDVKAVSEGVKNDVSD